MKIASTALSSAHGGGRPIKSFTSRSSGGGGGGGSWSHSSQDVPGRDYGAHDFPPSNLMTGSSFSGKVGTSQPLESAAIPHAANAATQGNSRFMLWESQHGSSAPMHGVNLQAPKAPVYSAANRASQINIEQTTDRVGAEFGDSAPGA
jgi:hypothetical protein